jgi:serine/threonine protein kinase
MGSNLEEKKLILREIMNGFTIDEKDDVIISRRQQLNKELAYLDRYTVSVSKETFADVFMRESVLSVLGRGCQGIVYETVYGTVNGNVPFVFKRVPLSRIISKDVKTLREIDNHKDLSHPNVVQFYFHCIEFDQANLLWLNLFMEKCANGDLYEWLKKNAGPNSSYDVKKKMFLQICSGLKYIHSKKIDSKLLIHRDLKPKNILLDSNNDCKIADLGLSRLVEDDFRNQYVTRAIGTPGYAAPEKMASNNYGRPADIFSLGMIWMEFLCIFPGDTQRYSAMNDLREVDVRILRDGLPEKKKPRVISATIITNHPNQAELILKMTEHNPDARPDIDQVIQVVQNSN